MKKYWTTFKLALQTELQYRFNFFTVIISELLSLGALTFLWLTVYSEGNKIGDYNLNEMIIYYVLMSIIFFFLNENISWEISNNIREGEIINHILKPFKYIGYMFCFQLGNIMSKLTYLIIILAGLTVFTFHYITINLVNLLFFIFALALALILNFLIFYIIGLVSFWFHSIFSIDYGFYIISSFLAGAYLPLDLFPDWLIKINNFLPFRHLFYSPVSIFLNKIAAQEIITNFIIVIIWIIGLFLLTQFMWQKGIKTYEAYGR